MSKIAYEKEFRQFFTSSAGEFYIAQLKDMIDKQHEKAENEPELAHAYTQRAKGIREALNVIVTTTAERKPIREKLKTP